MNNTTGRRTDDELECDIKWRLARRHGWSRWVSEDALIDNALSDSEAQRGRQICKNIRSKLYVMYQNGRGYRLKGMPEQNELAHELLNCGYSKFRIETTLSPFERAGGFDP